MFSQRKEIDFGLKLQPFFLGRLPPPAGAGAAVLSRLPMGAPVHAVRVAEHHHSNTERVSAPLLYLLPAAKPAAGPLSGRLFSSFIY